jgi:hypothetical protein
MVKKGKVSKKTQLRKPTKRRSDIAEATNDPPRFGGHRTEASWNEELRGIIKNERDRF